MRRLIVLGLLLFPSFAFAQSGVNLDRAMFAWNWTQGTGGSAMEFRIKCGASLGVYPSVAVVPDPAARTFPVKEAIGGAGTYHCIVTAANQYGESPPSGEVVFRRRARTIFPE